MFKTLVETISKTSQSIIIFLIKIYQYTVSPFLGPHCRFYPSCSHYTCDSIRQHGLIKGAYLSIKRILRCHPLSAGGYDPVPSQNKLPKG